MTALSLVKAKETETGSAVAGNSEIERQRADEAFDMAWEAIERRIAHNERVDALGPVSSRVAHAKIG